MELLSRLYKIKSLLRHNLFSKNILERNIKKISICASGVMLDIGCGQRPYKRHFRNVNKYWGIDLPPRVRHGSRKVKIHGIFRKHLDSVVNNSTPDIFASALALPISDSSVDTVLMTEVLEHIASPTELIIELKRILNPKGIVISTVPFCWPLHETPYDYQRYTKWGLKELFVNGGFEIVTIEAYGDSLFTIGCLITELIYNKFGMNIITNIPISILCLLIHMVFIISGKIFKNGDLPFGHFLVARIAGGDIL